MYIVMQCLPGMITFNLFHDREVTPAEVFTYEGHRVSELSFDEMRSLGWRRLLLRISRNAIKD